MKVVRSKFDGTETFTLTTIPGDVVLHFLTNPFEEISGIPADFWILNHPAVVVFAARLSDLPSWFTLHPSEMQNVVATTMIPKLKGRFFPDPIQVPNAWRVKEGDRIAFLCERPWTNPTENAWIIEIGTNALVFHQHPDGRLPDTMAAGGAIPSENDEKLKQQLAEISARISLLGLPRSCSLEWGIGLL